MSNLEKLKEQINNNQEVKKALDGASDTLLLDNFSLIQAALSDEDIKPGYKLKITMEDDYLNWEYIPSNEDSASFELRERVINNYKYKLPLDWQSHYLININENVRWTTGRKELADSLMSISSAITEGKKTKGIWIKGKSGSGKTWITISLLNKLAMEGKKVSFVGVQKLLNDLQATMNNFDSSAANILDAVRTSEVLVLDDIGAERPTIWGKENILLPILDHRCNSGSLTIFTSNISIEKYKARLRSRSSSPETEGETNDKIISRIEQLISKEVEIE